MNDLMVSEIAKSRKMRHDEIGQSDVPDGIIIRSFGQAETSF